MRRDALLSEQTLPVPELARWRRKPFALPDRPMAEEAVDEDAKTEACARSVQLVLGTNQKVSPTPSCIEFVKSHLGPRRLGPV